MDYEIRGLRVVLYARVSTDEQKDNTSLDGQIVAMRRFAEAQGLLVVAEYREDESGFLYIRPEMNKVLDSARKHEFDMLLVLRTDRYARAQLAAYLLDDWFHQAGVRLWSIETGEFSPGKDRIRVGVERLLNEEEAAKLKRRMHEGRQALIDAGIRPGQGIAPFGYMKVGSKKESKLVIHPEQAMIVQEIFRLYTDEAMGTSDIARLLNDRGIPTPRRQQTNRQTRWNWHPENVQRILANDVYAGIAHVQKARGTARQRIRQNRDQWIALDAPAIVSADMFEQARVLRQRNREKRYAKHFYLMQGRVMCHCGRRGGCAYYETARGKPHAYYLCNTSKRCREFDVKCGLPHFKAPDVDWAVYAWIDQLYRNPATIVERLKAQQERVRRSNQSVLDEQGALQREISRLHQELESLIDDKIRNRGQSRALAIFDRHIKECEAQITKAEARLSVIEQTLTERTIADQTLDSLVHMACALHTTPHDGPWAGVVQDAQSLIGLPPPNEHADNPWAHIRAEVERLGLTITLAYEEGERVLYVHVGGIEERIYPIDRVCVHTYFNHQPH